MSWKLSRFRTGDLVEVRSQREVLDTLDERGCVDGMPFMPEMLRYCGQRFRVSAVAHKTCETAYKTHAMRRLEATVHLSGLRCDGSAHGGCQAACSLFWKDQWLKPVDEPLRERPGALTDARGVSAGGCTEEHLRTLARASNGGDAPRYSCQATHLYAATRSIAWWDLRHFIFDVTTGNRSAGQVLRVVWLASLRWLLARVPFGYRLLRSITDWMHRALARRPMPALHFKVRPGEKTPTGRLDLQPRELVRIKSEQEIAATLDARGLNRGLSFDPEEMAPYCGRTFAVQNSVTQIINEATGEMMPMKQPCVILEDVVCSGSYALCRLNCPRAITPYWREIWLERVSPEP